MTTKNKEFYDRSYATIGRFVVKFEEMVDWQRAVIQSLFASYGLRNSQLAVAAVSDLTADPIWKMLRSMLATHLQENKDEHLERVVANVLKRIRTLVEVRNDVVHGRYRVEIVSDEGPVGPFGVKVKHTRLGAYQKVLPTMEELEKHAEEAHMVSQLLVTLQAVSCFPREISSVTNFSFDERGNAVKTIDFESRTASEAPSASKD